MLEAAATKLSPAQWQEAYRSGDAAIGEFYRGPFGDWWGPFEARQFDAQAPLSAAAVAEWEGFLTGLGAGAENIQRLRLLSQPGATVVVTGQQAGVGTGPLYTIWKALGARAWAAEVEAQTGKPCIPVFWVASDDHDLAEIEKAVWLGADGAAREASLAPEAAGNARSIFEVAIDPARAEEFLKAFEESTTPTEFREPLLALLRESLAAGATFESHFLKLIASLLLPLGILPVVPRLGFVRRAAAPLIAREISVGEGWQAAFRETAQAMGALGMEPPLVRSGHEANFFVAVEGVRAKIVRDGGEFVALRPGTKQALASWTEGQLLALLAAEPGRFSPNALLRPLVQDAALPTVAYIAGPSELVYHGQLGPLYPFFEVTRPAVIPRPNVALLEAKTLRAAEKLGLTRDDLAARSRAELERKLDALATDAPLAQAAEAQLAKLNEAARCLAEDVRAQTRDTGLLKSLEKLQSNIDTGVEKFRERLTAFLATQDSQAAAARERVLTQLFPGGEPQERHLTALSPLLVNHGAGILEVLAGRIDYRRGGVQGVEVN